MIQLGGLITYGIGQMDSFPVWRGVFLICGGITVVWGVILLVFLPNSILTAKRFTVEEKILLIGRGKQNQTVSVPTLGQTPSNSNRAFSTARSNGTRSARRSSTRKSGSCSCSPC